MDKVEQIFKRYERQAKARNLTWRISFEDFERLIGQCCHYCGTFGDEGWSGLDRVDNRIGYILTPVSNVVPACAECNFAKRVMTSENFIRMAIRIAEHQKKIAEQKKKAKLEQNIAA
jgi:hypothetical protein